MREIWCILCLPESDQPVLNEVSLSRMKNESACLPVERRVFGEVSAPFQANYIMRQNLMQIRMGQICPLASMLSSLQAIMTVYHLLTCEQKLFWINLKCWTRQQGSYIVEVSIYTNGSQNSLNSHHSRRG